MNNLKSGILWSAIDRFSVIFIQIIIEIILARIIAPESYGLIALASMFLVFGNILLDSGFSKAIIQKQDRSKKDFSTMFYLNLTISVIIYIIVFYLSDVISEYFNKPSLSIIIKILSINLIITGFSLIQRTQLVIELNFKRLAKISFISVVISGIVSVIMALNGFGVWALVTQSVLVNLVTLILFSYYNPIVPKINEFSKKSFVHMFKFGGNLTLSSLVQATYQNSFTFLIGKNFTGSTLGFYNKSNQFTLMPISVLTNIINRVTYPEFSKLQDNNLSLAESHLKFIRYFTYLIFPVFIGFASISSEFIYMFLGDNWLGASQIIKILAISYIFFPFIVMNMTIFQIKNRTKLFFHIEIFTKVVGFCMLIFLIPYGIIWVCLAILFSQVLQFFISTYFSNKLLNSSNKIYLKIIFLNLCYFLIVFSLVLIINSYLKSYVVRIFTSGFLFLTFTLILLYIKERSLLSKITNKIGK